MRIRLEEAARVCGGRAAAEARAELTGVSVDSRRVRPGDLFVALRGEVLDGHDFVVAALRAGAAAAMVSRPVPGAPGPLLVVGDPLAALARLAAWVRDAVDPLVVGVTGSTGKTSTKDLLAAVARRKYRTVASERSYNNELGVPLTILSATEGTEAVVCELGARGPRQIAALCEWVRPQVGVVTNVGVTHHEQFGSQAAIGDAKGELVRALPEGGTAVLNADDPLVAGMARETRAEVLTFGSAPGAWMRVDRLRLDRLGRPAFRLLSEGRGIEVELEVSGAHQAANAAAAAAAGRALGLSLDECAAGLSEARASPWRMEVTDAGGIVVVNDAYNASPTSVESALRTCAAMVPEGGRLVALLGYMAELGELEEVEHARAGRLAASLAHRLVVVGERARWIAEGARAAGLREVAVVPDPAAALDVLSDLRQGDVLLVKASRVAGLESLAGAVGARARGEAG